MVDQAKIDRRTSSLSLNELRKRLKEKYRQLMKTNEWTHEEVSLKVQVNQKKPKKSGDVRRCCSNLYRHTGRLVMFTCSSDASNGQSS